MVCHLFRSADMIETEFFFVDRPLKNHKCFSNKTARIHSACKSAKFFRVSLKKRSLPCDGVNSAKSFKFKAFNVKTQMDRLQTSPVFADHCFNACNLEKCAARYQSPRGVYRPLHYNMSGNNTQDRCDNNHEST